MLSQRIPQAIVDTFCNVFEIKPYSINRGYCYNFALTMLYLYGKDKVTLWTGCDHAWVEIDGIFYDSEHLDGIKEYKQHYICCGSCPDHLPKCPVGGSIVTEQALIEYWEFTGASGPAEPELALQVAEQVRASQRMGSGQKVA